MSSASAKLIHRVLKEEIDAMGEALGQISEEYVGGKPYVFKGRDSSKAGPRRRGRKRDQIRLIHQRVSARTGVSADELRRRYPGLSDLGGSGRILFGTYREDPVKMAEHEERMAAKS